MKNLIFALIALISFSLSSCGQNNSQNIAGVSNEVPVINFNSVKKIEVSDLVNMKKLNKNSELGETKVNLFKFYAKENFGALLPAGAFENEKVYVFFCNSPKSFSTYYAMVISKNNLNEVYHIDISKEQVNKIRENSK